MYTSSSGPADSVYTSTAGAADPVYTSTVYSNTTAEQGTPGQHLDSQRQHSTATSDLENTLNRDFVRVNCKSKIQYVLLSYMEVLLC